MPVSATFGCETCCGKVSRGSDPEVGGRSLALFLGWSRLTRNAVGMSLVNSACVFRNCGLALIVAVASLTIVAPSSKKERNTNLKESNNLFYYSLRMILLSSSKHRDENGPKIGALFVFVKLSLYVGPV